MGLFSGQKTGAENNMNKKLGSRLTSGFQKPLVTKEVWAKPELTSGNKRWSNSRRLWTELCGIINVLIYVTFMNRKNRWILNCDFQCFKSVWAQWRHEIIKGTVHPKTVFPPLFFPSYLLFMQLNSVCDGSGEVCLSFQYNVTNGTCEAQSAKHRLFIYIYIKKKTVSLSRSHWYSLRMSALFSFCADRCASTRGRGH